MRRVFSKGLHDGVIVRNVDDFHLVNLECHDLADSRESKRFEGTRHRDVAVTNLCRQHFGGQLLLVEFIAQLQRLDVVKEFDDFFIRAVTERSQKCSRKKLPASLASVEINVKKVSRIKLDLNP